MKILHTSDIHLREHEDERWKTLVDLLEIGKKERINLFAISGDLFDKDVFAEELRPKIREIFSENSFKIILIPGNHDKDSFRSGLFFGEDVVILNDFNNPYEYENLRVWGMPFNLIGSEDILEKLRSKKDEFGPDKTNILLFHGELLDTFFSRNDFGEEGEERYMPVKLSYFKELNINYVLAGHFHTKFEVWQIDNEKYFVYPGSPISITKRERGLRKVNLFNVGAPPKELIIESPHYQEICIEFDPINDLNPIQKIDDYLQDINPNAKIMLNITGYLNCENIRKSEEEIIDHIKKIIPSNCIEEYYEFKDANIIMEDDLFEKFQKKINNEEIDLESKKKMTELLIKAMMRIK